MSFSVSAGSYDRYMGRYSRLLAPLFADFAQLNATHLVSCDSRAVAPLPCLARKQGRGSRALLRTASKDGRCLTNSSGLPMTACVGQKWTRSQRIRTAAAIPVTALIVDAGSTPVYLTIAGKAARLRELGMSDRSISRALGGSDKTVAKSLQWLALQLGDA